jgi:hypothetical protein
MADNQGLLRPDGKYNYGKQCDLTEQEFIDAVDAVRERLPQ